MTAEVSSERGLWIACCTPSGQRPIARANPDVAYGVSGRKRCLSRDNAKAWRGADCDPMFMW